jgi:hypothetical protein
MEMPQLIVMQQALLRYYGNVTNSLLRNRTFTLPWKCNMVHRSCYQGKPNMSQYSWVLSHSTLKYRPLIATLHFNIPIVSSVYSLVFSWSSYVEILFLGTRVSFCSWCEWRIFIPCVAYHSASLGTVLSNLSFSSTVKQFWHTDVSKYIWQQCPVAAFYVSSVQRLPVVEHLSVTK